MDAEKKWSDFGSGCIEKIFSIPILINLKFSTTISSFKQKNKNQDEIVSRNKQGHFKYEFNSWHSRITFLNHMLSWLEHI